MPWLMGEGGLEILLGSSSSSGEPPSWLLLEAGTPFPEEDPSRTVGLDNPYTTPSQPPIEARGPEAASGVCPHAWKSGNECSQA